MLTCQDCGEPLAEKPLAVRIRVPAGWLYHRVTRAWCLACTDEKSRKVYGKDGLKTVVEPLD